MLPILLFALTIGSITGKEVFCDYNEKYCQGREHVLCVTEEQLFNDTTPEALTHSNSTELENNNINNNLAIVRKMLDRAPKGKEECESACYSTDTISIANIECGRTTEIGNDTFVCEKVDKTFNCIKYYDVTMTKNVDYVSTIEDYHLVIFYILFFGVFLLNISICVLIKTLSRYY